MTPASRRALPLVGDDPRENLRLLAIMRENRMWPGAGRKYAPDYAPPPATRPIALKAQRKREGAR